jgi:hypothetical protein
MTPWSDDFADISELAHCFPLNNSMDLPFQNNSMHLNDFLEKAVDVLSILAKSASTFRQSL